MSGYFVKWMAFMATDHLLISRFDCIRLFLYIFDLGENDHISNLHVVVKLSLYVYLSNHNFILSGSLCLFCSPVISTI